MITLGRILRTGADFADFVSTGDPEAKERLISEGKPLLDEAVSALADAIKAQDAVACGYALDWAREKGQKKAFFQPG